LKNQPPPLFEKPFPLEVGIFFAEFGR